MAAINRSDCLGR